LGTLHQGGHVLANGLAQAGGGQADDFRLILAGDVAQPGLEIL
jgi:hypothetical protein